jgi:ATP-dependent Clp protease adaptor protein ClpS
MREVSFGAVMAQGYQGQRRYTRNTMSTVAPPVRKQQPRVTGPGSGSDRPWLVVVKNDNHNTFDGVAFALARTIPGLTFDGGMQLANRIHTTGQAVVWRGQFERAELYHEQLAGFGLTMAPLTQSG